MFIMLIKELLAATAVVLLTLPAFGQNTTYYGNYTGTQGYANAFFGYRAGYSVNSNSGRNVGIGNNALSQLTSGSGNVGVGSFSLNENTTGDYNTGIGFVALRNNTTGKENVSMGCYALASNTTGHYNSAIGAFSLRFNETGTYNTAQGYMSMRKNKYGVYNTVSGAYSLENAVSSYYTVAIGVFALRNATSGGYNTTCGASSLYDLTSGSFNTAVGQDALDQLISGSNNVGIGSKTGASFIGGFTNSIALGFNTRFSASNQARIGNSSITSIGGQVGWTSLSDARFKSAIQEDVLGLEFINALRPVSYKVDRQAVAKFDGVQLEKGEQPAPATYHTGFLAQEVEQVTKALGFERFDGVDAPINEHGRYGLRYASFVVPLVKAVQELSNQVDDQAQTIKELHAVVDQQQTQIDALLKLAQQRAEDATLSPNSTQGTILYQNTPNPFSEETTIRLHLPETTVDAYLMVTNLEGRQLFQQSIDERGETSLTINAHKLPAGLYIYTLVVNNQLIDSKKMLITE